MKIWLKSQHSENKDHGIRSHSLRQIDGETVETVQFSSVQSLSQDHQGSPPDGVLKRKKEKKRKKEREFPSSPAVRTWHTLTAVCAWFQSLVGELRSCKSHDVHSQKQIQFFLKKKKVEYSANWSEGRGLDCNIVSKFNSLEGRRERRQWRKKSIFFPSSSPPFQQIFPVCLPLVLFLLYLSKTNSSQTLLRSLKFF